MDVHFVAVHTLVRLFGVTRLPAEHLDVASVVEGCLSRLNGQVLHEVPILRRRCISIRAEGAGLGSGSQRVVQVAFVLGCHADLVGHVALRTGLVEVLLHDWWD